MAAIVAVAVLLFPSPQGGSETGKMAEKPFSTKLVSIPSRRVGDLPKHKPSKESNSEFPSPQGGSETRKAAVGDAAKSVSIPSRRVGDQGEMRGKAGKRRQKGGRVAVDLR